MQGRKGDVDIENGLADMEGAGRVSRIGQGEPDRETSFDIYTHDHVQDR